MKSVKLIWLGSKTIGQFLAVTMLFLILQGCSGSSSSTSTAHVQIISGSDVSNASFGTGQNVGESASADFVGVYDTSGKPFSGLVLNSIGQVIDLPESSNQTIVVTYNATSVHTATTLTLSLSRNGVGSAVAVMFPDINYQETVFPGVNTFTYHISDISNVITKVDSDPPLAFSSVMFSSQTYGLHIYNYNGTTSIGETVIFSSDGTLNAIIFNNNDSSRTTTAGTWTVTGSGQLDLRFRNGEKHLISLNSRGLNYMDGTDQLTNSVNPVDSGNWSATLNLSSVHFTGTMLSGKTFSYMNAATSGLNAFNSDNTLKNTSSSGAITVGTWNVTSAGQLRIIYSTGEVHTLTLLSKNDVPDVPHFQFTAFDSWTNTSNASDSGVTTLEFNQFLP